MPQALDSYLTDFQGLPCVALALASGDKTFIALQGAHVLSWQTANGKEQLYLSPKALLDGQSAIRGGVPICFPQFNTRAIGGRTLPKHGFARTLRWRLQHAESRTDAANATLVLAWNDLSKTLQEAWPLAFEASLQVRLSPKCLKVSFAVKNTDVVAWSFALALHTYLRVRDIAQVRLHGLQGVKYSDAAQQPQNVGAVHVQSPADLSFDAETDRVYQNPPTDLQLHEGQNQLQIKQSSNLTDTVVWNPGAALCARMSDMPTDGYQHMICVEAAKINDPVLLTPGASWQSWQQLTAINI